MPFDSDPHWSSLTEYMYVTNLQYIVLTRHYNTHIIWLHCYLHVQLFIIAKNSTVWLKALQQSYKYFVLHVLVLFFNNHDTSKWYEIWCIILKFKLSETFELNILVTRNILNYKKDFKLLHTFTCIWHIHYSLVEHFDAKKLQKHFSTNNHTGTKLSIFYFKVL